MTAILSGPAHPLIDHPRLRLAAWIGATAMAAVVVVTLALGYTRDGLVLGAFLGASVAFLLLRSRLPALFDLLFVIAALGNGAGFAFHIFRPVPGYDEVAHAYTSFAATLAFAVLAYGQVSLTFHRHPIAFALAVASLGLSAGALWEIFEWSFDRVFDSSLLGDLDDTIGDLALDAAGAGVASAVALGLLAREPRDGGEGSHAPPSRRPPDAAPQPG